MPAHVRLGDSCSGHGCFSPRPNVEGSDNVFVNGIPSHRLGDGWSTHCCMTCHGGNAATGSPNVFVNGRPSCRIGDMVSCGSTMVEGSYNVFTNGG